MNQEREPKEPAFKVVDKRRFSDDGSEKQDKVEAEQAVLKEQKQEPATKNESSEKQEQERPSLTFSLFVQSLAHQAMMGLGLVAWPDSGLIKKNIQLAKESIDIIRILKEKTSNNLSADEERLIDAILYQLQVAFVDSNKNQETGKIIHS